MLDKMIALVNKKKPLNRVDGDLFTASFTPISMPAGTFLERTGQTPKYMYFVNRGFLRLFHEKSGEAVTTSLFGENDFAAPFLSFIHQSPSPESMHCITDCELLKISYTEMKDLIEISENFKYFSLSIFEDAMARLSQRADDLATLTALERYKKLAREQPSKILHLPGHIIASFLGIRPQSLSRIRRQVIL